MHKIIQVKKYMTQFLLARSIEQNTLPVSVPYIVKDDIKLVTILRLSDQGSKW
jgi:hypothetical protein